LIIAWPNLLLKQGAPLPAIARKRLLMVKPRVVSSSRGRFWVWVWVVLGGVVLGALPVLGASYVVTTTADNTTDDSECTLREAILAANNDSSYNGDCGPASSGDDTITFSVSGTITLTSTLPNIVSGAGTLTINGGGNITISGGGSVRVMVNSGNLTVQNLTIANGNAGGGSGGGIRNSGTLTVTNSTFSGNSAGFGGGIVNVSGTLTVTNSTFSNNTAATNGGGIYNDSNSTATVTNSTFSNNNAGNQGGGIYNAHNLTVTNSTFSNNNATSDSGGIFNSGALTVTNSTFSGNSAANGGGIRNSGTLTVTNSTFSGNSAGFGGGIRNFSTATLQNTIIANSTGGDCVNSGGSVTGSNNLIEDTGANACGLTNGVNGNIIGSDPNLGALTGSPAYFPLNPGSLAIDAGTNSGCPADSQNGVTRPQGPNCDIGSYEAPATACVDVSVQAVPTRVRFTPSRRSPATRSITVRVRNNSGSPIQVTSITPKNPPFGGDYSVVRISPPLPRTVLNRRTQTFIVMVRKAAGTPAETVNAPFFDVQLSCGLLPVPAWQKSTPLQVEALRVRVGAEQLEVEATGEGIGALTLELFDLSGRKRLEQQQTGSRMSAALSPLANGVYFYVVRVRGDDGREYVSEIRKLVIVR
jgi:CSLREA domain-containing protein